MAKDPVCGMSVDETGAMHAERGGKKFFFCSAHCRTTFLKQLSSTTGQNDTRVEHSENDPRHRPPESAGTRNAGETSRHTTYTCPMHPEIEQDHPGDCPKCGMALEPTTVTAATDDEEHAELRDMTRRFWIGAAAIVQGAQEQGIVFETVTDFRSVTAGGVLGTIAGRVVMIGKPEFLRHEKIRGLELLEASAVTLQEDGKTAMFVAIDGKPAGILAVADPIKATTAEAIRDLHALGLELVMLTGDNRRTAAAVASQLGLDAVQAQIEPAGKVAYVQKLRAAGTQVAMAGDGINDAPALSAAAVGIAMGTGTDVAMQSAGITLVRGDLRGIAKAIRLSRATMRNIRQNSHAHPGTTTQANRIYKATCSLLFSTTRWVFRWRRGCCTRSSAYCSARSLPAPP